MAVQTQYADQAQVYQDIGKTAGADTEIDDLVDRSDQDASGKAETIFNGNVDFDNITEGWFTNLVTRWTSAIFWWKSNGTTEAKEKVDEIEKEAKQINIDRFFPTQIRY